MRDRDVVDALVSKSEKEGEMRYRAEDRNSMYREYEDGRKEFIDVGGAVELKIPVRSTHLSPTEANIGKIYIKEG